MRPTVQTTVNRKHLCKVGTVNQNYNTILYYTVFYNQGVYFGWYF